MNPFENDIESCLSVLQSGGIILYPTDTIWGVGCDATNEQAVERIFFLKKRPEKKALIILLEAAEQILNYVSRADVKIMNYLSAAENPTTVIYEGAKNVAKNLINEDGTVAIRIVKDDFCATLLRKYGKPVVSTSANISGTPSPQNFKAISGEIKNGVDYIVQHRQSDTTVSEPSSILRVNKEGDIEKIR